MRLWQARTFTLASLGCAMALVVALLTTTPSAGAGTPVSAFPIPGSKVAPTRAQLAFRGLPASQLGTITVTGSKSGVHTGTIEGDSDGLGASFIPAQPFTAGETVTVVTALNIRGASSGRYSFTVSQPLNPVRVAPPLFAARVHNDAQVFRSRPDLRPVSIRVVKNTTHAAPGYYFFAPQAGPLSDGPLVVDSHGHVVWYKPLPRSELATDVRVQTYQGKPVLTWWQGSWNAGVGRGVDVINNTSYQQIATVRAANGMDADLHEFQITRNGADALITAYYPVWWDESSAGGPKRGIVFDSVVQEIDIATGLVMFQWDSLDHVPLTASTGPPPKDRTHPYNYFHINSVTQDDDGDLIISGRNTSAVYKVDINTGAVIWTLGGKYSSFKFGHIASFAFQHDVRVRAQNDAVLTMFDDGGGPPDVHGESRGLKLRLDLKHMTASTIVRDLHAPPLLAEYEGNDEELPNGDDLIGWGEQPYFSEYTNTGQPVFDARLGDPNPVYRVYKFSWSGSPQTLPALAVTLSKGVETAYASWNGSTSVYRWRVLGGSSATSLAPIVTAANRNFETAIRIRSEAYVEVQALGSSGQVLATSLAERPH